MAFQRSHSTVGIECSDQQIRAVRITATKKCIWINATALVDVVGNSQQSQLTALMKAHELLHYKREPIIYALNHDDVITKSLAIDATLNDEEIRKYLETQSSHIFGHAEKEIFIEYASIHKSEESQQIQAVAARKTHVNQLRKLLASCRFKLKAIDVNTFSMARIISLLTGRHDDKKCIGIFSFQQNQLLFCAVKNKRMLYSVSVDYPRLHTTQLTLTISPAVNRTLQFFNTVNSNQPLEEIILMGEPDHTQTADHYLKNESAFKSTVAAIDPNKVQCSSFDERLFVSLGVALWNTPL